MDGGRDRRVELEFIELTESGLVQRRRRSFDGLSQYFDDSVLGVAFYEEVVHPATPIGELVEVDVVRLTVAQGVRHDALSLELMDRIWKYACSRALAGVRRTRADANPSKILSFRGTF